MRESGCEAGKERKAVQGDSANTLVLWEKGAQSHWGILGASMNIYLRAIPPKGHLCTSFCYSCLRAGFGGCRSPAISASPCVDREVSVARETISPLCRCCQLDIELVSVEIVKLWQ